VRAPRQAGRPGLDGGRSPPISEGRRQPSFSGEANDNFQVDNMTDLDSIRLIAHRQNAARYRRLLRTQLTYDERRFIQRRLAQEQAEIEKLQALGVRVPPRLQSPRASTSTVIAAQSLLKGKRGHSLSD